MTRYVVEEELAAGGMGVVYRVLDTATGAKLALKRLRRAAGAPRTAASDGSDRAKDPTEAGKTVPLPANESQRSSMVDYFEREYKVLASLNHPRIIRVFDYGVDDAGPFYTMELLDGQDLKKGVPLPYRTACLYLRDVATCLALLHARRLIHRDLSPSNVRTTDDGHCKVLDFGALTSFGPSATIVGTPPLVPPEALQFAPLDQRADLFALGALAYWMLTGRHAYPAHELSQLFTCWEQPPRPPSALAPGIPAELDELVMSLLSLEPLSRPGTAGEVIARLSVIGELPETDASESEQLAQSFLVSPPFTGREAALATIEACISTLPAGSSGAICVQAPSGMGRTRLLEEVAVRAQLVGATVLRADARTFGASQGISRALVTRLFEAEPELARRAAPRFRVALARLGLEIPGLAEVGAGPSLAAGNDDPRAVSLEGWFAEVAKNKPLAVLVDNVEYAGDAGLALLAALAKLSHGIPLLVVVTERKQSDSTAPLGLVTLRTHSKAFEVAPLSGDEVLALMRSLFGEIPNLKRFAAWIHERSAGSPLHALEIVRRLVARHIVRHTGGIWTLPVDRPEANLPAALEDMLAMRIAGLSHDSRILAECLSLQRERTNLELCRLVARKNDDRELFALLEELARNDVLHADGPDYRFSSMALCDVLLASMDPKRLAQNHRRVGEAFATIAGDSQPELRLKAGWHSIQGGDEVRGAEMIAKIARDPVIVRSLLADLHRGGHSFEAALSVYGKHRRSSYERLPLFASLAQAGYYEHREFADRYGDSALDVLEDACGLSTARRLRPFFGAWLALVVALVLAAIRFRFVPRSEKGYSFAQLFTHLFSTVSALSAAAAVSLDSERGERVAATLEPFAVLPKRLTPVGVYEYCSALADIARDEAAKSYSTFEDILKRLEDPTYYRAMPADARKIYIAGAHFACGSFAIFRAHSERALENAAALERCGIVLYATIASQLRSLYHLNRGEFDRAAEHREQFELRAAELGSLWQVETWEGPALTLVYTALSDIVSSTRVAHRVELLSRTVPSLRRYAHLAGEALMRSRRDPKYVEVSQSYADDVPRSYIGWGATMAFWAAGHNELGRHADAKRICENTLAHVTDADREYASLFLNVDLQLAIADAGLRQFPPALERIDGLLARFADCGHPLVSGLLHETRARIALAAGKVALYDESLTEVERWFVGTGTPVLIARYEHLSKLRPEESPGTVVRAPAEPAKRGDFEGEVLTSILCGADRTGPDRQPTTAVDSA